MKFPNKRFEIKKELLNEFIKDKDANLGKSPSTKNPT